MPYWVGFIPLRSIAPLLLPPVFHQNMSFEPPYQACAKSAVTRHRVCEPPQKPDHKEYRHNQGCDEKSLRNENIHTIFLLV